MSRCRYSRQYNWAIVVRTAVLGIGVFAVSGFAVVLLGVWLVGRPLHRLANKARRIGEGDLSGPLEMRRRDEMGEAGIGDERNVQPPGRVAGTSASGATKTHRDPGATASRGPFANGGKAGRRRCARTRHAAQYDIHQIDHDRPGSETSSASANGTPQLYGPRQNDCRELSNNSWHTPGHAPCRSRPATLHVVLQQTLEFLKPLADEQRRHSSTLTRRPNRQWP